MKVFGIKATLLRSNPQLIRVLMVPCNITLSTFHQILQVVIGWRSPCDWEMEYGEIVVSGSDYDKKSAKKRIGPKSELQDLIKEGSTMQYRFGDGLRWKVRLQIGVTKEEDSLAVPAVIRYRGDNLKSHNQNIREYNYVHQAMKREYSYRSWGEPPIDSDSFQEEDINFELQMRFGERQSVGKREVPADFSPDFSRAVSIRDLFENQPVDMLRRYADYMEFPIVSGLKKKQLVEALQNQYRGTALLRKCLNEMSLQEYELTKMLYQKVRIYVTDDEREKYETLGRYRMICNRYDGTLVCTKEFLEGYRAIIRDGYERRLYKRKKVEAVIYVGCRLYGAITENGIKELVSKYYPDEYSANDINMICKGFRSEPSVRFEYAPGNLFFDGQAMSRLDVNLFIENASGVPRYIPEYDEYERLENGGFSFEKDGKELENILIEDIGMFPDWANVYHKELYHILQKGGSVEQTVNWLLEEIMETCDRRAVQKLKDWLESHKRYVRKYILNGYTEDEIKNIQKTEQKPEAAKRIRVFPNDPCPCGSGKKYKKCCGRR